MVKDALIFSLKEDLRPVVYFSYLQAPRPSGQTTYEVRVVSTEPPLSFNSKRGNSKDSKVVG